MTSETKGADRRKEPRYEILIRAKVVTSEGSFTATAKNISGGGMEIQLVKPINPDTNLTISLQLHEEEFVFEGKVVWTLGDYINKGWIYRTGIKTGTILFKDRKLVDDQEKRKLVQQILPRIRSLGTNMVLKDQKAA
jgi:hypothetical protein